MNSKMRLLIGAAAAAAVLGGIVWLGRRPLTLTPMFQNEPIEVRASFPDGSPVAGGTQHIHLQINKDGQPFAVYDNQHAIHFIVVSLDHNNFFHTVDLQEDEVGVYGTDVTFGPPGRYRMWVEVNDAHAEQHHHEGTGFFGFADLEVGGALKDAIAQPRVIGKEVHVGPYTVKLAHRELRAGVESELRVTVEDEAGRLRALTQPEPNIYVIVGPKGDPTFPFIRHGHSRPPENGNTVVWKETFPKVGQYLLWTTVYLEGVTAARQTEAVEVPFVLTVTQ